MSSVSAALRLRSAQGHAGAGCSRYQAALGIGHIALDQSDGASALDNVGRGREASLPDRTEEIDLEFQGGECLIRIQRAGVGETHSGIGEVAQDSAVDGAHRIRVALQVSFEFEDCSPKVHADWTNPDQLCDGRERHATFEVRASARSEVQALGRGAEWVAHENPV
jgi:hypothetical protein